MDPTRGRNGRRGRARRRHALRLEARAAVREACRLQELRSQCERAVDARESAREACLRREGRRTTRRWGGSALASSPMPPEAALGALHTASSALAQSERADDTPPRVGIAHNQASADKHAPPLNRADHLEAPARTDAALHALHKTGLLGRCVVLDDGALSSARSSPALHQRLRACHSAELCDALRDLDATPPETRGGWTAARGWAHRGSDMYHNHQTRLAAESAASCVLALVERVVRGELDCGFAVVRPPGHHAGCAKMHGFCFVNSVAVAARAAVRELGVARVLIVDWDVHHGDGTQAIFWEDPAVLYASLHRYGGGFFPGTGAANEVGAEGAAAGRTLNVPWRREGMGDAEYLAAFDHVLMPVARDFAPDLILVSAGFDAAAGDAVGGMALTPTGYASMAARLATLASGRVVYALEGGYKPSVVAKCTLACVRVMLRDPSVGTAEALLRERGERRSGERARPSRASRASRPSRPSGQGRLSNEPAEAAERPSCELCAGAADNEGVGELRRNAPRDLLARGAVHTIVEVARAHAAYWPSLRRSTAELLGMPLALPQSVETTCDPAEAPKGGLGAADEAVEAAAVMAPPSPSECCAQCKRTLPRSEFARSQLERKRRGARRCRLCARGDCGDAMQMMQGLGNLHV